MVRWLHHHPYHQHAPSPASPPGAYHHFHHRGERWRAIVPSQSRALHVRVCTSDTQRPTHSSTHTRTHAQSYITTLPRHRQFITLAIARQQHSPPRNSPVQMGITHTKYCCIIFCEMNRFPANSYTTHTICTGAGEDNKFTSSESVKPIKLNSDTGI